MPDREETLKGLEHCANEQDCRGCPYFSQLYFKKIDGEYNGYRCKCLADALTLLKEREVIMTPDEFKAGLKEMFSSIWDCEIEHPVFQDTVGDLMKGVIQLYKKAVKRG